MKAFLLAAGYGTRLRPLTDSVPKCLVPICGRPLLGRWLELLCRHGVSEVLINTHYLPDPVRAFLRDWNQRDRGLTACESYERELLGSGGTVRANRDFVRGEKDFLICYADNLTDADLSAFAAFHRSHGGVLSMALFHSNVPRESGIAELDGEGRIVSFVEKPENPQSDLANAGLYLAGPGLFDALDADRTPLDFGRDVLPKLVGRMYGWPVQGYLRDIGTWENYRRADEEWAHDHHEDAAADQLCRRRD